MEMWVTLGGVYMGWEKLCKNTPSRVLPAHYSTKGQKDCRSSPAEERGLEVGKQD